MIRAAAADAPPRAYAASPDRIGWAILIAGAIGGVTAMLLNVLGGDLAIGDLGVAFLAGAAATIVAVIALGAPFWLAATRLGARGPGAAAVIGFMLTAGLLLFAQTGGFAPGGASRAASYRWLSAATTSVILGLEGAAIALTMWRVAYRRVWAARDDDPDVA